MFRALAANLILHERIETTDTKAKELRRVVERIITRAKRLGTVAYTPHEKLKPADRARRLATQGQIGRFLQRFGVSTAGGESKKVDLVEKVFLDLAKRFEGRPGGYTRIVKLGRRRGDNAPMALIELLEDEAQAATPKEPEKDEKKPAKKTKAPKEAEPKEEEKATAADG